MKYISLILAVLILSGCSMPNTKPGDGRQWIEVSCSGFANWTKCHEKAHALCEGDYDVANQEESLIAQRRTMMVACHKQAVQRELTPQQ